MDKYVAREVVKNIMQRDYERWLAYENECITDRSSYTESFYVWKENNQHFDSDIDAIVDAILGA